MNEKGILLIFHKPLNQVDGQTKYVKELIGIISTQYDVLIPSENFYKKYGMNERNWMLRTILVNVYLIFWALANRKSLSSKFSVCIMEDRYALIPTLIIIKIFHLKLVSRLSDWGQGYVDTLNLKGRIPIFIIKILDLFYKNFVISESNGIIVPSDYLYLLVDKNFKRPILNFPLICKKDRGKKIEEDKNIVIRDNNHDVYCVLVGNFNYAPNEDSALYLIKKVIPEIKKKDKKIKFVIIGAGSDKKFSKYNSDNLISLGIVEDLSGIYRQCQIGINLSTTKGGTSIKNIEYLVNGLIVVSTKEAAVGVFHSSNLFSVERKDFKNMILEVASKIRSESLGNIESEASRVANYYSEERVSLRTMEFLKIFY
ncbi:glycosyltransferase [Cuniculiplasma sp. SKW3]|uniref:glycosyltransferase n=1 Tax=unclassified Cuniculiplasma TaxID=2619706 RepID=UPI003FD552F0